MSEYESSLTSPRQSDPAIVNAHTDAEIEDADFKQVANTGNLLVLPEGTTRGEAIQQMAKTIPTNDYGLPAYYLRSDLIDLAYICHRGSVTYEEIDYAGEMLSYHEGYPTLTSGSPFWTQLPHEPHADYLLFQRYLELDELEGIRLLDSLARYEQVDLEHVRSCHQEFFWSSRARAYDLFIVAAEAKKREVRIRKTENKHFNIAGGFLTKFQERLENNPELIEQMDGKQLLDALEQMVKIQRLSLGLVGQHASSSDPNMKNPGASTEVIIRNLTKNAGLSEQSSEAVNNRLAVLMADEDTAMQVQELIVRTTTNGGG